MVKFIKSFMTDENGASAAEYALILAVIGTAIVAGAIFLGQSIGGAMNDAGECVASGTAAECN